MNGLKDYPPMPVDHPLQEHFNRLTLDTQLGFEDWITTSGESEGIL